MPYVVRNVETDEIHFIQSGNVKFETDVGSLTAEEGDFVCIPRAIAYRYAPTGDAMRSVIVESPAALKLSPPAPTGMLNVARDLKYAKVDPEVAAAVELHTYRNCARASWFPYASSLGSTCIICVIHHEKCCARQTRARQRSE